MHARTEPEPSAWVRRFRHLITPGGSVLDLACGGGRHTKWLLGLGHRVTAVDRNREALKELEQESGIEVLCMDLESEAWPFAAQSFDAVVVTNYLHRPLFRPLCESMRDGGVLIYETFAAGNERYGRPVNPDFLLRSDELLERTASLQIVAFEQGRILFPRPAVIQRICAVRSGEPASLESGISIAGEAPFG
jgi:SAM-dependent methyltransferase